MRMPSPGNYGVIDEPQLTVRPVRYYPSSSQQLLSNQAPASLVLLAVLAVWIDMTLT